MELALSPEDAAFRDEVRAFIKDNYPAEMRVANPETDLSKEQMLLWHRILHKKGWIAPLWPKEYGGPGWSITRRFIFEQETTRAGTMPPLAFSVTMVGPVIYTFGNATQKAKFLPRILSGEDWWCQGYSEPGSGSDLAAAKTSARVEDSQFIVNGQKIWTSSAHYADMMFLLCRTELDKSKHDGLSYLLVPMNAPGIEVRPLVTMTGRAEFNETFFTDVRVPTDQIVMGRGDGWHVANVTLKYERMLLGDANKLTYRLARAVELMKKTTLDGCRFIDIPEYRERLLKLQGEVMASKYHGLRLMTEQAKGEDSGVKRLIVKLNGTMIAYRLSSLVVDVLGAAGLAYEPVGEAAEDDEATTWQIDNMYDIGLIIGGGSSNIQKNIIGERGLGLPREPKSAPPTVRG